MGVSLYAHSATQTMHGLPIYHEVFAGNAADLDEDENKR